MDYDNIRLKLEELEEEYREKEKHEEEEYRVKEKQKRKDAFLSYHQEIMSKLLNSEMILFPAPKFRFGMGKTVSAMDIAKDIIDQLK